MDPVEALQRLGGVATLGELIGPTTRGQVRGAERTGEILRLRHNRYALVDTDHQRSQAIAAGGVLSHLSAALHWGWAVKHPPVTACVTMPRGSRKPTGDLEVRWAVVPESDTHRHVTRRARTVVDCARAYDFDVALAVADSALREGEVSRHELLHAAARAPRIGRSKAIAVIEAADARAANPFESVIRAIALGVPGLRVEPQGEVAGVGWVDLLDRRLGIVIEADSFEFHGTREGLRRDVRRYTDFTRRGLVVVRFTWEEAMFQAEYVHQALVDTVRRQTNHHVASSTLSVPRPRSVQAGHRRTGDMVVP